ncbi:MAG TPA: hypothetical protein PLV70_06695 [Flavobacteriales bacterium]|nr:hypothetical protein [Flavobacteriales bacterium]
MGDLVHQYRKDVAMQDLRSILVLTENGCPACNRSMAKLVEDHLADTTSLVWVSAMGGMVDISPFRSDPERVVWDYGDSLRALGIMEGSGAIFLQDGRIDTVIHIEAHNLETALALVAGKLDGGRSSGIDREGEERDPR